ncbi:MAG: formate/nitrite transporter family protein, partial [Clostridiales bacterium]|nr:formate/nitrite transporter family protein [Clostridiales bacterium]
LFAKQFYTEGTAFQALSWGKYFAGNMLPVTLGNVVGGFAVALLMWYCYVRKPKA